MADAAAIPAGEGVATLATPSDHIDPKRLITFICMVFGMFMSILDIQIVSASLTDIQAGLAASTDEVTWVQTAYLIAEVIMIPLSGFLSRALGTRYLFAISAAGFTLASLACGFCDNINDMIFWRAVQGFIGGGMIPTVFAAAYTIFPRSRLSLITPMIGLVATLAPTIGPTVGGYLTDTLSWHWLFFINVIPGIGVTIAALTLIDFDEPNFALFDNFDYLGLASMAGFLGALEYVLEEGPRNNWFGDQAVLVCAWISGISAVIFFARVLTARAPIVDLYAFSNRNFALGSISSFVLGIGLYGLTYIYPLYLSEIRGYDALQIGETVFVSGVAMFMAAPVAGRLTDKVDPRYMLAFGFLCVAFSNWWISYITTEWDFWELLIPQIFRGVGLMCAIIPITNISLGTLPPEVVKNASGLFNLTRNLGGAFGLAGLNTILDKRTDLHLARLHEDITFARQPAVEMLNKLTEHFHNFGTAASDMALKQLYKIVHQQGLVMGFADTFYALMVLYIVLTGLALLMNKPDPMSGGGGGH